MSCSLPDSRWISRAMPSWAKAFSRRSTESTDRRGSPRTSSRLCPACTSSERRLPGASARLRASWRVRIMRPAPCRAARWGVWGALADSLSISSGNAWAIMTRRSNATPGSRLGEGRAGAIVIGGAPVGLAIVRSLGRNGIPVCVLREGDNFVATTSRFRSFSLSWPNRDDDRQIDYLVDLATTRGLEGWTVYPTSDETAALLGRYHEQLSEHFVVASPPWSVFRWAYDKRLTYRLAADVGVACPRTYYPRTREEVAGLDCAFPVILKPAVKLQENVFTHAKAWP